MKVTKKYMIYGRCSDYDNSNIPRESASTIRKSGRRKHENHMTLRWLTASLLVRRDTSNFQAEMM